MDDALSFTEQLSNSANEFWDVVGGYLPNVFAAIVLLVVALVVARLLQAVVVKGLSLLGFNKLMKNKHVENSLKLAEVKVDLVELLGRITFWVVIIIFALTIANVLDLTAMSDVIREIVDYLPSVLAAVIVLTVTIAGARLVQDVIAAALSRMQVDYAGPIAAVAFYVLVIFGSIMALDQLGFQTAILTANITVIVAGVMLAFALAFGLGGKEVAGKIVNDAYANVKKHKRKK